MNKYIKKCLLVYVSMAIILCGMVGVTYAITASDADQYVTRSQYAVDMAHLQNKLDEQEAGLMGNINRYRSTDVKFVTYDNPLKEYTGSDNGSGKYNGGNFFPRQFRANAGGRYNAINGISAQSTATNANISLYRLWNGNYLITNHMGLVESSYSLYPTVNFAIPCENLPGWYLECRHNYQSYNYNQYLVSLVKLDPTVPYHEPYGTVRSQIANTFLQFRFKKEFFKYTSTTTAPLTPTKLNWSGTVSRFYGQSYDAPFSYALHNTETVNNKTVNMNSWLDESTGDYMLEIKGLYINCPGYNTATMNMNMGNSVFGKLIVSDNVEYLCGNTWGYLNIMTGGNGRSNGGFPPPCYIGTREPGTGDLYWDYEFVDGANGIKYWHAYRTSGNTAPAGDTQSLWSPVAVHYNIPILY